VQTPRARIDHADPASAVIEEEERGQGNRARKGQLSLAALPSPLDASPLVQQLAELWRWRQGAVEARCKLILQARAVARRACGGDKAAAERLYGGADVDAATLLAPYLAAQAPLTAEIDSADRLMARLARGLPVADWARAQKGFGLPGLAKTVGELGDLSAYRKGVAGVWKRAGLAVIDGGRQRRVSGDAALLHGYAPGRRSTFWNIAAAVLKAQGTGEAAGPWRAVYDRRKALELTRVETPMHAHNRAMRFMTKRLLRDLHRAWCAA
jgi:hypothetical protein